MLKVTKTTYMVEGEKQPCYKVYDPENRSEYIRIVPYYHYIGATTTLAQQICDKRVNSSEELGFKWSEMNKQLALYIARHF